MFAEVQGQDVVAEVRGQDVVAEVRGQDVLEHLGVTILSSLAWKNQCDKVCSKTKRTLEEKEPSVL